MTMENYKQKYEGALERAKDIYSDDPNSGTARAVCEQIFPELKKSKDELIREEILSCFVEMKKQGCFPSKHKEQYDSWISWLEKQGEQKHTNKESKFKVGDWVVFNTGGVYQVERIKNYEYTLRHTLGGSMPLPLSSENLIRPWTIQDAKDGDVLASANSVIILVKESRNSSWGYRLSYHCAVLHDNTFEPREFHVNPEKFLPATKEQRNLLFQKMYEAGYEWHSNKKELTRYEQ